MAGRRAGQRDLVKLSRQDGDCGTTSRLGLGTDKLNTQEYTMSSLTVEDAASINAFVQQLHNAAAGALPVDEETLALQMLASAHADSDFDASHIKSPSATSGPAPVAMAAGDAKFDKFVSLLMGDIKSPEDQVANGQVPKPPPVVVEDPIGEVTVYDRAEATKNFAYLKDAQSVCQMFTNIILMQTNPDGFDITKEAAQAFNVQAALAYKSMAGPMGGVYNFSNGAVTKHTFDIPKGEVHEKLLGTMFKDMGLDKNHKLEIDSHITNFVKALGSIKTDGPHSTLDFALRFGLCPASNIAVDEVNPLIAYEPTTYLIYLKIDAKAFKQIISKNNSQEKITLTYEQVITKFELNVDHFIKQRPKFNAMLEAAIGMSLKEYSDRLNKPVKK
ncbi:hypothetical protein B0H67DRAFT_655500 [Lasiosphaeris hirsuta]|uniref:Uncharacterized protein n=1 Tax=Lasiosphaeris hirsuta TaxID=260670 RepID=A0AA40BDB4_9PEZI|nr:hypothetical protein B0H67DRAFT_655500 [Lasiosphaeris hirsuta]